MKALAHAMVATVVFGASAGVFADDPLPTVIGECPKGFKPANLEITLKVSSMMDCPLLEDAKLRKLVDRFGVGSTFAWPAIAFTCISGTDLSGKITIGKNVILVEGYSESAQRLLPEAEAIGGPPGSLFLTGLADKLVFSEGNQTPDPISVPFGSGAALTVVAMKGKGFKLDLVLADRFTIDYSKFPPLDTEDFLVIGAKGDYEATGRLTGLAEISASPGEPLDLEPLSVSGTLCLKGS